MICYTCENCGHVKEIVPSNEDNIKSILAAVCVYFNISENRLKSMSRKRDLVYARHLAMYLMVYRKRNMLTVVAHIFNGRDHTTVIHARQSIAKLMDVYPHVVTDFENIIRILSNPLKKVM